MIPARGRHQRFHRRLLRRDGRGVPADGRAGARGAVQEQLHFQVQRRGRARRPPSSTPTTCPRRSSGGGTTSCWPCRTPSAWRTTSRYLGRTVEILVEGPSKVAKHRGQVGGQPRDGAIVDGPHPSPLRAGEGTIVQLVGRTTCDRIVVFDGPVELTGRIMPMAIEKVDAFTLFGRRA